MKVYANLRCRFSRQSETLAILFQNKQKHATRENVFQIISKICIGNYTINTGNKQ